MSTQLLERPDTEIRLSTDEGDAECAHIVLVEPGEDATVVVLTARIEGTPVTALCGFVWVPHKDPKQLPVCQKCADIYEGARAAEGSSGSLRPLDKLAEETA